MRLVCRWTGPNYDYIAWIDGDSSRYNLTYVLQNFICTGATVEILEVLPDDYYRPRGAVGDACDKWRTHFDMSRL
jgi:hypothetical protein